MPLVARDRNPTAPSHQRHRNRLLGRPICTPRGRAAPMRGLDQGLILVHATGVWTPDIRSTSGQRCPWSGVRRNNVARRSVLGVRLYRNMPGFVPILREPINTQYIPILAGLAEWQSSNLFQYLQKSCSRIVGVSTRPVICRSGRPNSRIDPIEPPTIAQECCAITQIRRNVRLERFSEPPT